MTTRDDATEQGNAIETVDKVDPRVDEEPNRCVQNVSAGPNEPEQNRDEVPELPEVPEVPEVAVPSEKSNTIEGLAVTRKLKPKEKAVLRSRIASESTDSDAEAPIDCISTSEEEMLFATVRQDDASQPSLEIPTDAANEPLENGVVEHPESSHDNSSNIIDEFINSVLEVPADKSGPCELPLDDAIDTAAVVCVDCRRDSTSTSGESLKSPGSADDLELDSCSVSDIETNSNSNEIEQHSPVNNVAQDVETEQLNIVNDNAHDGSLHEGNGEADNNDIPDRMLELTEGINTINDIKEGVEVNGEKFRNMIQCAADIIGVAPEELLQLWI